ncbi:MAG: sulfotransferase, partial [Candidatus Methylomirabilales bacterium]
APPRRSRAARGEAPDPMRLLYIGGWGRSGSTLLARMLGQLPGYFYVGEVRYIWQKGCLENRLCGCGARFHDCPFWTQVGREAFGGWGSLPLDEILRLRGAVDRPWWRPSLVVGERWHRRDPRLEAYTEVLERLYRAISGASGGSVIVDSSKAPSYALILRGMSGADLRLVHLVRDSRGVAFSWQKRIVRPDTPGATDYMIRYALFSGSARYDGYNLQTHALRFLGVPYLFMRYEDLIAEPRGYLERVVRHAGVGVPEEAFSFMSDHEVALSASHSLSGNPMRLKAGALHLRPDEEWRAKMGRRERLLVSAITLPMLLGYRYPVRV